MAIAVSDRVPSFGCLDDFKTEATSEINANVYAPHALPQHQTESDAFRPGSIFLRGRSTTWKNLSHGPFLSAEKQANQEVHVSSFVTSSIVSGKDSSSAAAPTLDDDVGQLPKPELTHAIGRVEDLGIESHSISSAKIASEAKLASSIKVTEQESLARPTSKTCNTSKPLLDDSASLDICTNAIGGDSVELASQSRSISENVDEAQHCLPVDMLPTELQCNAVSNTNGECILGLASPKVSDRKDEIENMKSSPRIVAVTCEKEVALARDKAPSLSLDLQSIGVTSNSPSRAIDKPTSDLVYPKRHIEMGESNALVPKSRPHKCSGDAVSRESVEERNDVGRSRKSCRLQKCINSNAVSRDKSPNLKATSMNRQMPRRSSSGHPGHWCRWTKDKLSSFASVAPTYFSCRGLFSGRTATCSFKAKEQCPAVGKRPKQAIAISANRKQENSEVDMFFLSWTQHLAQNPATPDTDAGTSFAESNAIDSVSDEQMCCIKQRCRILGKICTQSIFENLEEVRDNTPDSYRKSEQDSTTVHSNGKTPDEEFEICSCAMHHPCHRQPCIQQRVASACTCKERTVDASCDDEQQQRMDTDGIAFREKVDVVAAALVRTHDRYVMKVLLCEWAHYHTLRRTESLHLVALKGHANAAVAAVTRCNKSSILFVAFRSWAYWVDTSCINQGSEARLREIDAHQSQLEREWNEQISKIMENYTHETNSLTQQIQYAQEAHEQELRETGATYRADVQFRTQKICRALMIARSRDIYGIIFSHWMQITKSEYHIKELEALRVAHQREMESTKRELRQHKQAGNNNSINQIESVKLCKHELIVGGVPPDGYGIGPYLPCDVRSDCSGSPWQNESTMLTSSFSGNEQESDIALSAMKLEMLRRSLEVVDDRRRYDLLLLMPGMQRIADKNRTSSGNSKHVPSHLPCGVSLVQASENCANADVGGSCSKRRVGNTPQQPPHPHTRRGSRPNMSSQSELPIRRAPVRRRWSQPAVATGTAKVQTKEGHARPKRRVRHMMLLNSEDVKQAPSMRRRSLPGPRQQYSVTAVSQSCEFASASTAEHAFSVDMNNYGSSD